MSNHAFLSWTTATNRTNVLKPLVLCLRVHFINSSTVTDNQTGQKKERKKKKREWYCFNTTSFLLVGGFNPQLFSFPYRLCVHRCQPPTAVHALHGAAKATAWVYFALHNVRSRPLRLQFYAYTEFRLISPTTTLLNISVLRLVEVHDVTLLPGQCMSKINKDRPCRTPHVCSHGVC